MEIWLLSFLEAHIDALTKMSSLDIVADFYDELLTLYNFEGIVVHKIKNGEKDIFVSNIVKLADIKQFADLIKNKDSFKSNIKSIKGDYGLYNLLHCHIGGAQDIEYLDTILPIVDPWGRVARFLAVASYNSKDFKEKDLRIMGKLFKQKESLIFDLGNDNMMKSFHNVSWHETSNKHATALPDFLVISCMPEVGMQDMTKKSGSAVRANIVQIIRLQKYGAMCAMNGKNTIFLDHQALIKA